MIKVLLFGTLLLFWGLLFYWMGKERFWNSVMCLVQNSLSSATKKREQEYRNSLLMQYRRRGILYRLEKSLIYSGVGIRFPWITPEIGITICLGVGSGAYFLGMLCGLAWWLSGVVVLLMYLAGYVLFSMLILRNYNRTEEELLKFLDFLGNYSITSGEITSILRQVSVYLREPLKTVLEEGYLEAQTSGNTGLALMQMAEKIQHPKFKEIICNMEVSLRYSADFTILVSQSRRSVREDIRMRRERKNMAKEAWINILILGVMTVVILRAVEALVGVPMTQIVVGTVVGRLCISGIGVILVLFALQVRRIST